MRRLIVTIRYDGTNYHGWQVQCNAPTVQETFQNAVEKVFKARLDVKGCSRTDAGVHANRYVLTLDTQMDIAPKQVVAALNARLPADIAVLDCRIGTPDFHPRYSCISKAYVYKLYNGKQRDPFLARYAYWYRYPLDADYLHAQAQAFVGTHDYSGFCSAKSDVEDTVRTVKSFSVSRSGDMVLFRVEADGFLYNMVRIMVGTLLFVAQGKIEENALADIIRSKDRRRAGKTAPPQGLYLDQVYYDEI